MPVCAHDDSAQKNAAPRHRTRTRSARAGSDPPTIAGTCDACPSSHALDPVLLELVIEGAGLEAQKPRGLGLHSGGLLESLPKEPLFHTLDRVVQVQSSRRKRLLFLGRGAVVRAEQWQIVHIDDGAVCKGPELARSRSLAPSRSRATSSQPASRSLPASLPPPETWSGHGAS